MSTDTITIYVRLLNEGTDVRRPTTGVRVSGDVFRVEPTADYDPDTEEWEFPPGSEVVCAREVRNGVSLWIADKLAANAHV